MQVLYTLVAASFVIFGGHQVYAQQDPVLHERIDNYHPESGAFLGSELTWYSPQGSRLRWEILDATGTTTLLFFVTHDSLGRESRAIYFEGAMAEPDQEVFTYSADGRVQTTTYYYEPGEPADQTMSFRDEKGREVSKKYFRKDGSQYGKESVYWNSDGTKQGWKFSFVHKEGGATFRYAYLHHDEDGSWLQRMRLRDEKPERLEVCTRYTTGNLEPLISNARFAPETISTDRSETSPSFTKDGQTMVFARYDDDWSIKEPFIAFLEDDMWRVEILSIGIVYNLAISPDGNEIYYATRSNDRITTYRVRKAAHGKWTTPEDLTRAHGIRGSYLCLSETGTLFFYDAKGSVGAGIYSVKKSGESFGKAAPFYIPVEGTAFDAFAVEDDTIWVTQCYDDQCETDEMNGIWEITRLNGGEMEKRKLSELPYAWGVQPVKALNLMVFTNGEDILSIPLRRR